VQITVVERHFTRG